MAEMNYSRQEGWFEGYKYNKQVSIVGVGATGSWLALNLAKMGVRNIHVWDFDVIEEHNVANQAYGLQHVGMLKTEALRDVIKEQTGTEITIHSEAVTASNASQLKGIVYVLTDSMASRKEIAQALQFNMNVQLIVETRMGIDSGRIYVVKPMVFDALGFKKYQETLYDDTEAEVSFCGSSLSIVASAQIIAGYASWVIIKDFKGLEQTSELLLDFSYNNLLTQSF